VPVAAAAAVTLGARLALWGGGRSAVQAVAELALFLAACALFTWLVERPLLREVAREARSPRLTAEPSASAVEPLAAAGPR
jgi:peptidoglycan/LPS O-acetylase OafA/YrhL